MHLRTLSQAYCINPDLDRRHELWSEARAKGGVAVRVVRLCARRSVARRATARRTDGGAMILAAAAEEEDHGGRSDVNSRFKYDDRWSYLRPPSNFDSPNKLIKSIAYLW